MLNEFISPNLMWDPESFCVHSVIISEYCDDSLYRSLHGYKLAASAPLITTQPAKSRRKTCHLRLLLLPPFFFSKIHFSLGVLSLHWVFMETDANMYMYIFSFIKVACNTHCSAHIFLSLNNISWRSLIYEDRSFLISFYSCIALHLWLYHHLFNWSFIDRHLGIF